MSRFSDYNDSLYDAANVIFDEVVFTDEDDLAAYNAGTDLLRDELYDIIGEMLHDAEQAMFAVAEENKERFLRMVREELKED